MNQTEPVSVGIKPLQATSLGALTGFSFGDIMDTKYCSGCETEKSVKEFSKNRRTKDGLEVYCKACCAVYQREYYASHKSEKAAYRAAHKAEKAAYQRAHRPECNARVKAYHLRYPMRRKAHNAVSNAIASGKLIRPGRCSNPECNIECKPEAHHHNGYKPEYWLDVIFLCTECHRIADAEMSV